MFLVRKYFVAILLLSVPIGAFGQDWTVYKGDNQRTGRTNVNLDPLQLQPIWSTGNDYFGARIVGDRVIATHSGPDGTHLRAFSLSNGNQLWSQTMPNGFVGTATVFGDFVAMASGTQGGTTMGIFRVSNGELVASAGLLDSQTGSPLVRERSGGLYDIVLATSNGAMKWTFNGASLAEDWSISLQNGGFVTPSMMGSSVIFAGVGHYNSVDLDSGTTTPIHDGNIGGGGGSAAVVDAVNDRLFIHEQYNTSIFGALTAYRRTGPTSFEQIWQYDTSATYGHPALTEDGDLIGIDEGRVIRFDGATGGIEDQSDSLGIHNQAVLLSEGVVWVGTSNGLMAMSSSTLEPIRTLGAMPGAGHSGDLTMAVLNSAYLVTSSPFGGGWDRQGLHVYAVPEPATIVCLAGGFVMALRRRRKP